MDRLCRTCSCEVSRHERVKVPNGKPVRVCPTRLLTEDERIARDLPTEPHKHEPPIFIVDRSLLAESPT